MQRSPLSLGALGALIGAAALLAGCASVDPEAGWSAVQATTRPHLPQELRWSRSSEDQAAIDQRVAALLSQPLGADDAVQLALLNHRGLQARLHDLGIAAADLAQAGRLPNPGFAFGRSRQGDEVELERTLHFSLLRLLTLPMARQAQARANERVQREVAMDVLTLAADTRKAWVMAVAAEEAVRYMRQVQDAAEASAELARRMEQVGNFNRLMRLREQSFYADAALGLARAQALQQATRERLTRQLGLWGTQTAFRLPERLPDLPAAPRERPDIERQALAQRLDVAAARLQVEHSARSLGLTQATRWVNVFEIERSHNTSNEGPRQTGWEIGFELPLFDMGDARVARADSSYRQALQRAAQTAIEARSEVRQAYASYRNAWDIAQHQRDEIVPLKKRISDEQLLRYNGMLIGVFELLADARSQITAVAASIEALRDFWLAQAELEMALIGKAAPGLPSGAPATAAAAAADPH